MTCSLPHALVSGIGVKPLLVKGRLDRVQSIKLRRFHDRQLAKQQPLQKLKYGKICADGQGQSNNHGGRESGRLPNLANSITNVLSQPLKPGPSKYSLRGFHRPMIPKLSVDVKDRPVFLFAWRRSLQRIILSSLRA
jgi:hypothetical protein